MSESNAREIREDAGQAGKGSVPAVTAALTTVILDPGSCDSWPDPGLQNVAVASESDARLRPELSGELEGRRGSERR